MTIDLETSLDETRSEMTLRAIINYLLKNQRGILHILQCDLRLAYDEGYDHGKMDAVRGEDTRS